MTAVRRVRRSASPIVRQTPMHTPVCGGRCVRSGSVTTAWPRGKASFRPFPTFFQVRSLSPPCSSLQSPGMGHIHLTRPLSLLPLPCAGSGCCAHKAARGHELAAGCPAAAGAQQLRGRSTRCVTGCAPVMCFNSAVCDSVASGEKIRSRRSLMLCVLNCWDLGYEPGGSHPSGTAGL